jgi:hypothetical protein
MVSVLLHNIQSDLLFALVNHILDEYTYNDACKNTQSTAWGLEDGADGSAGASEAQGIINIIQEKKDNDDELWEQIKKLCHAGMKV